MSKYKFPAGCSFGGAVTDVPVVRGPVAFTDPDGIQRPRTVFKRADLLSAIGVKPWVGMTIPAGYTAVEGTVREEDVDGTLYQTADFEAIPDYADLVAARAAEAEAERPRIIDGKKVSVGTVERIYAATTVEELRDVLMEVILGADVA